VCDTVQIRSAPAASLRSGAKYARSAAVNHSGRVAKIASCTNATRACRTPSAGGAKFW